MVLVVKIRILPLLLVLLSAFVPTSAENNNPCPSGSHTLYSQHARPLDSGFEQLNSPDGTKTLTVRTIEDTKDRGGAHIVFTVQFGKKQFSATLVGFNAEVLWSPNSKAFAVTQQQGGGGFDYLAYVFLVGENGLRKLNVSEPIRIAFRAPGKCQVKVHPNIAVVDWLYGSSRILIAGEVPSVSICDCPGSYKLYEVTLPERKIERSYPQSEAKQKFWPILGCELRNSASDCATSLLKPRPTL